MTMNIIILFVYYFLICSINCFELILLFYIILQFAVMLFPINENSIFHKIYAFLYARIEPIFAYIRRFIPPIGMLDFSALVLFIGLFVIRKLISVLFLWLLSWAWLYIWNSTPHKFVENYTYNIISAHLEVV